MKITVLTETLTEKMTAIHKSENEFGLHKSEKIHIIFVVWLGRFAPFAK